MSQTVHPKPPVPADAYYGTRTAEAGEYLNVCDTTLASYPQIVATVGKVKKACALTNKQIRALDPEKADAIIAACDDLIAGRLTDQFPLCVFGSFGAALNAAANEVLASRANEILAGKKDAGTVSPADHVNMGQSANDVMATARALVMHDEIGLLLEAVPYLEQPLADKAVEFRDVVKMGRTSYQDAIPITLGQVFSGFHGQIRRNRLRLEEEQKRWNAVPLGATALGTGLGCMPGYFDAVCGNLSAVCGREITRSENLFDAMQSADAYVMLHAHVQTLAMCAARIAADIRIMASGPRAGLSEITLKPLQPGSSIMPGKMNPVVPHMVMQISQRISANHAGVALAASSGELDSGPVSSVVAKGVIDSMELIRKGMKIFGQKVVTGVAPRTERCRSTAERSLSLSAVISALFGYETGGRIARIAAEKDVTCKEAAVLDGLLSRKEADELFDVLALTDIRESEKIFAKYMDKRTV